MKTYDVKTLLVAKTNKIDEDTYIPVEYQGGIGLIDHEEEHKTCLSISLLVGVIRDQI